MAEEMRMKLAVPNFVMSHFCLGYARALLAKLKDLIKEDRVYQYGRESAEKRNECQPTKIASSVITKLSEQIDYRFGSSELLDPTPGTFDMFIETAEEFLAIF